MISHPKDPIRAILVEWTGGAKPPDYVKGYDFSNLTEEQRLDLQLWCIGNAVPDWLPGETFMQCAELAVKGAVANGKIPDPNDIEPVTLRPLR